MNIKKNSSNFWQQLHTLSQRVSDAKVVVFIIGGTVISVVLGFANFYFNYKLSPIYAETRENTKRITTLEKALPDVLDNVQIIADFINEPKVKVLRTNPSDR